MRGKKSTPKGEHTSRIFYCNIHGRITEDEYEKRTRHFTNGMSGCSYCDDWYHSIRRSRVKRWNES